MLFLFSDHIIFCLFRLLLHCRNELIHDNESPNEWRQTAQNTLIECVLPKTIFDKGPIPGLFLRPKVNKVLTAVRHFVKFQVKLSLPALELRLIQVSGWHFPSWTRLDNGSHQTTFPTPVTVPTWNLFGFSAVSVSAAPNPMIHPLPPNSLWTVTLQHNLVWSHPAIRS